MNELFNLHPQRAEEPKVLIVFVRLSTSWMEMILEHYCTKLESQK